MTKAKDAFRNGADFGTWTYVIPEEYEYTDRGLQRASDYIVYRILPGTYPVRLTNIGGSDWNPDRDVHTPGFIANVGPYFAVVQVDAIKLHTYYESQLFSAIRGEHKDMHEETTYRLIRYGYEVSEDKPGFMRDR